jgi:alkyldihydroxyacetonephosphate synthase
MVKTKESFTPPWSESAPPERTFRAILKWGAPDIFKHPNYHLYEYLKSVLGMTDADLMVRKNTGEHIVNVEQPARLTKAQLERLSKIVGTENVKVDDYSRAAHAYGKSMLDLLRLRAGKVENPPDAVVYPRNANDIKLLVAYCNAEKIPVTVFSGGTSVTRGVECLRGGISLNMRAYMNRIVEINDQNQTVTVQPGIDGPSLEKGLNQAKEAYGTLHNYTCGHFPQSFEFSTVGGWVVTRGAGQNSTYYGKIENLVLSQKYVTPVGDLVTVNVPAKATGPDLDQIMIGSEGAFGILVEVTLKIFRYQPEGRSYFSFMFRDWESATSACQDVMQGEFGFPSVFRLSDPEETDVALKLYGIEDTILGNLLQTLGFHRNHRCLLLGHTDGDRDFGTLVYRKIKTICKKYKALNTTGYVTKRWEHGRFTDPYLREDLGDFGVVIDTLECGVSWSTLNRVWSEVRTYCHSRPKTICMAHSSHFYPQGTNLYFIFVTKIDNISDYVKYHAGILDVIQKHGATMSHHHGIGKMLAPWLEDQIGQSGLEVFRALKHHFDPNHILNPGGTLGLDEYPTENRAF